MLVTRKGRAKTTKELIDASIGMLIDALESGHSEVLTAYLSAMAKFHYYSFGNVLLIAMQKRNATRVASMYAWNQLGRRVRRGEKGIMIFAPMASRRKKKEAEEQEHNETRNKQTSPATRPATNVTRSWSMKELLPIVSHVRLPDALVRPREKSTAGFESYRKANGYLARIGFLGRPLSCGCPKIASTMFATSVVSNSFNRFAMNLRCSSVLIRRNARPRE